MRKIIDLENVDEVRVTLGDKFVATSPEHFLECMSWLLCNVDTDTKVTQLGIEPDDYPMRGRRNAK